MGGQCVNQFFSVNVLKAPLVFEWETPVPIIVEYLP
jgi:hypothetical protein